MNKFEIDYDDVFKNQNVYLFKNIFFNLFAIQFFNYNKKKCIIINIY